MNNKVRVIAQCHCQIGENPSWDESRGVLFWIDIPAGEIFTYSPISNAHKKIYQGDVLGGFTFQENGDLLLFQANKISTFNPETGEVKLIKENIDDAMERFNDVFADPRGRVFAGTIGKTDTSGGLYRVDLDGSIVRLFQGTGCSNGIALSPDHTRLYWTNTTTRTIFQFSYDINTGDLSNREKFIRVPPNEGFPDGLVCDSKGNIWSARWEGSAVYKYSPNGRFLEKIKMPTAKITSLTFAGPKARDVYVSSASDGVNGLPNAGAIFHFKSSTTGQRDFASKIHIVE